MTSAVGGYRGLPTLREQQPGPLQVSVDGPDSRVAARSLELLLTHPHNRILQIIFGWGGGAEPLETVPMPLQGSGGNVVQVLRLFDELLETRVRTPSVDLGSIGGSPTRMLLIGRDGQI